MKFLITFLVGIFSLSTEAQITVEGSNNTKTFSVKNGQSVVIGGSNNEIVIYGNPYSITVTGANNIICIPGRVEILNIKGSNAEVTIGTLNKVIFSSESANCEVDWVKTTSGRRAPLLNDSGSNNEFEKTGTVSCSGDESDESNSRVNTNDEVDEDGGKPVVINIPSIPRPKIDIKKWKIKRRRPEPKTIPTPDPGPEKPQRDPATPQSAEPPARQPR